MRHIFLTTLVAMMTFLLIGCTYAKYSNVRVHIVDEQTQAEIPKARVRTYYVKPMLDMTYQRKDMEQTDQGGFATLSVATNWQQLSILGWTYGITPHLSVQANGYRLQEVGDPLFGIPYDAFGQSEPLLIQMTKTNGSNTSLEPTLTAP